MFVRYLTLCVPPPCAVLWRHCLHNIPHLPAPLLWWNISSGSDDWLCNITRQENNLFILSGGTLRKNFHVQYSILKIWTWNQYFNNSYEFLSISLKVSKWLYKAWYTGIQSINSCLIYRLAPLPILAPSSSYEWRKPPAGARISKGPEGPLKF